MADRSAVLAAQGLDETDLGANRAGRVSPAQSARQIAVRRGGARGAWILALASLVGCSAVGAWSYLRNGDPGLGVFMPLFGIVLAALPLGIYYAFRFADPAAVAASGVTRIDAAKVGTFLPAPARGIYSISLDGKRHSGFASALTRAHLDERMNAYVVAEHRIVVALEPCDGQGVAR
ncbi:MAG TPA: hypothetical protein VFG69_12155 [Nannocystaceae bacterium]|nr:hypothetical protein [Nannocystaceae bacterium]